MGASSCLTQMSNNTLLVGSNGFLGKNIKKILQDNKNYKLFEIQNSEDIDILNYEKLYSFLNDNNIDKIINCGAFVGGISYGYKYQADLLSINSQMAINLYKASNESKVKILINPISNCAYPEKYTFYDEKTFWDGKIHDSVFNYGLSKRLYVALGEAYFKQHNFSSVNVVLSNMYGPLDHFDAFGVFGEHPVVGGHAIDAVEGQFAQVAFTDGKSPDEERVDDATGLAGGAHR